MKRKKYSLLFLSIICLFCSSFRYKRVDQDLKDIDIGMRQNIEPLKDEIYSSDESDQNEFEKFVGKWYAITKINLTGADEIINDEKNSWVHIYKDEDVYIANLKLLGQGGWFLEHGVLSFVPMRTLSYMPENRIYINCDSGYIPYIEIAKSLVPLYHQALVLGTKADSMLFQKPEIIVAKIDEAW
jgi:hypothetical protein